MIGDSYIPGMSGYAPNAGMQNPGMNSGNLANTLTGNVGILPGYQGNGSLPNPHIGLGGMNGALKQQQIAQQQQYQPPQQANFAGAPPTGLYGSEQALNSGLQGALSVLQTGADRIGGMTGNYAQPQYLSGFGGGGGGGGGFQGVSASGAGLGASRTQGLDAINSAIGQGVEGLQGFVNPGQQSQQQQAALSGALGPEAQQQAYAAFNSSPGQDWLQEQGMRQVTRGAAATGGLGGGRVLQELQRQGIGLAQQDYQNQFNNLGQITGQGLSAAQNIGQLRGQQAGQAAGLIGQLGSAQASLAGQEMSANAGLQSAAMSNAGANQRALMSANAGLQQAAMANAGADNRAAMSALNSLAQQGSSQAFDTGRFLSGGRLDTGRQIADSIGNTTSGLANLTNEQGINIGNILASLGGNQANIQSTAGQQSATELMNLATLLGNISQGQASGTASLPGLGNLVRPDNTAQNIGNTAQSLGAILGNYNGGSANAGASVWDY